ncbi:aspartate aminotransferase family protein [Pseudomonas sp. Pdm06]|uniref:aspartate aminotransferase family protein n=1 Tax=Pseudomonas sp. Pdm06 TaxID=1790044 RepID=UPI0017832DDC|nr:aminotransferase class III-fold pyridoxal phosphate-dependent enzyme [Pseudomonas sp. Pdm06]MBD9466383.1 aminotransferase class III-fold pyridoxal phosphate-dependent enzyme [Pseudomonas sp. Pdm06]
MSFVNAENSLETLLQRRKKSFASTYTSFYAEPLEIVRADDVWMYDSAGKAYLDFYNNVPVVGHSNPTVATRIFNQLTQVNTHTRYLTRNIIELSERLLTKVPAPLDRIIFTCTGSESNDLAYRVAKAVTGNDGFIVTTNAYHGGTAALVGLSPSLCGLEGLGEHTFLASGIGEVPGKFIESVGAALVSMTERGIKPAGIFLDSAFSSDGIYTHLGSELRIATELVRAAGGLVVADEVQSGFHRFGTSMWGFQHHGFEPDLVTLGKPMGNGYPIAALIGTAVIFDAFRNKSLYFNTFAGGNVAAEAALAVLDVIERDELAKNSSAIGEELRNGLLQLKNRFALIKDVRGEGLFVGVELQGLDVHQGQDVGALLVEDLKSRGILISATGPNNNVLKIRPPLTIKSSHISYFLKYLAESLTNHHRENAK